MSRPSSVDQKLDALATRFAEPVGSRLYRIFVSFFALKLVLEPILGMGPMIVRSGSPIEQLREVAHPGFAILLLASAVVMFSSRYRRIGLGALFLFELFFVVQNLPYTANHHILETLILGILFVWSPEPAAGPSEVQPDIVDGTACRLVMFAILTVYFWSAVQKIAHGYYLNGEFFSLFLFITKGSSISQFLMGSLDGLGEFVQSGPLPTPTEPDWLRPATFSYPTWGIYFLVLQSYLTLAAELVLPVMVVFARTRFLGALLLIPTAIAIALISGETGFALTNAVCLLLFFPRQARWSYPASFGVILAIHYARIGAIDV